MDLGSSLIATVLFLAVVGIIILYLSVRIVRQYERMVIFRLGRTDTSLVREPGLRFLIPFIDRPVKVDIRENFIEVPSQTVITRDNAPIDIDFLIYWRIVDPLSSLINVADFAGALQGVATTTLRAVAGDMLLDDVLSKRDQVNDVLRVNLGEQTERWGGKVTTVEIRELVPPPDVQASMNRVLTAERTRRAVITESEGKVQAIGAESFEISAEVIQGNSGGPILQTGTTTVLGLVSHGIQGRSDVWASGTRYTNIRKFGARMDRPIKWTKMPLTTFLAEIDKVEEFQRVTRLLYALSALEPGPNGLRLTTFVNGRFTAQQILAENHSMTAVQNLMKMNIELAEKRIKPDPSASKKRFADYYRGIISGSTRQITAIENLSPYHRDLAKESMAGRTEAHAALVKRLDSLTQ